jgi:type IV pilus assembly protein PilW
MNNIQRTFLLTRRQRGMSLVELMVAMTIGLIITVVIANLFLGTKQTYRTQDDLSRIQENLRFAFQVIGRIVRQAGYRAEWNRTIDQVFLGNSPIDGTNATGANASDILIVRFQGSGTGASGAGCLPTNSCGGADGRVLDCLGNRVDRQMGPGTGAGISYAENWLRVRTGGANGGTALFCSINLGNTWVEIVPDIDNMQVLYGEKTGPTAVDRYLDASKKGHGATDLKMDQVLNLRVALLHRSANLTAGETDTRTYNLVGTTVGPFNDQRIRLAATSNFVLRNRTQ